MEGFSLRIDLQRATDLPLCIHPAVAHLQTDSHHHPEKVGFLAKKKTAAEERSAVVLQSAADTKRNVPVIYSLGVLTNRRQQVKRRLLH